MTNFPGFTKLELTNFRAFQYLHIDLSPITLFFGPNSSGKSSIISAISILAQTIRSADPDVSLLLNGELEELGTYTDLVHGNQATSDITISIGYNPKVPLTTRSITFGEENVRSSPPYTLTLQFGFRSQRREIVLRQSQLFDWEEGTDRLLLDTRYMPRAGDQSIRSIREGGNHLNDLVNKRVRARTRNFIVPPPVTALSMSNYGWIREIQRIQSRFRTALDCLEFVGSFRTPPQRSYLFSGMNPRFAGRHGENALTIMAADYSRRGSKKKDLQGRVSSWLASSGLASKLEITSITDRQFEVYLTHPITGEEQHIADFGFGSSQVIPVLVAGFNADSGDTLMVEEPEIHLHPRAQAYLGNFLEDLYNRGVQAIVETHSEHLLLRLQRIVAEGGLPPAAVGVYYVHASVESKKIECVKLTIDEEGTLVGDWPGGFFPERLEEARGLLKAPFIKNATKGK